MFSGSLVAIVTPMRPDGALDFGAWERLVDFHVAGGTSGIVVGGTTGESATLSDSELWELTDRACTQARKRVKIIAGVGTSGTASTVDRARRLSELPIDGLLVVTPAYNRPTQEGLYQHFAAVSRATRTPVILYNVPARTAVDMLPATVQRLSQLPGIVAVKEAVADQERVRELVALCRRDFAILSGDDASARRSVLAGAKGLISVTANVAPRAMSDMIAAAMREDADCGITSRPVSGSESNPRQVGIDAHGNDRERHTSAAHRAVRAVPPGRAGCVGYSRCIRLRLTSWPARFALLLVRGSRFANLVEPRP
jgi:4-hydroxy-tetrahydrodipicolinate synthase